MAEQIAIRRVTVINPQGLHARPAHALVQLASRFQAEIEIVKEGERVDGKSILSILTLAAVQGTQLILRARGPDAEAALDALVELFQQGGALQEDEEQGPDGSLEGSVGHAREETRDESRGNHG